MVNNEEPKLNESSPDFGAIMESIKYVTERATQGVTKAIETVVGFLQSELYSTIKGDVKLIAAYIAENKDILDAIAAAAEETEKLIPFLQLEIDEINATGAEPITLDDVLSLMEISGEPITVMDGEPIENPYIELIERAKKRKAEHEAAQTLTAAVEQLETELPLLQAIIPLKHTMPNNALMNALQNGQKHTDSSPATPIINAGEFDLPVARENPKLHRKEITTFTMVSCNTDQEELQFTGGKMTEYERQVSDAIISLFLEAERQSLPPIFTTDMIFRAMPGGSDKASAQQKGAIKRVVNKCRKLDVTINPTEELRQRRIIGQDEEITLTDTYFSAAEAEYRTKNGGKTVTAYMFHAEPIILKYARMTNQLITVDAKYLEVRKVKQEEVTTELVAMTSGRQAMTGYMLRRIAVMQRDNDSAEKKLRAYNRRRKQDPTLEAKTAAAYRTQSNIISFATLFSETGQVSKDRETQRRNRKFCFDVLEYWKATGYIKDFKQQTKGKSITGVKIIL